MKNETTVTYKKCSGCGKKLLKTDDKYVHPSISLGVVCELCYVDISESEEVNSKVPMVMLEKNSEPYVCTWCHSECYGSCQSSFEEELVINQIRFT